ncbi:MAG TPA: SAM-dependent methyltransferase [Roseiflexaceae bacterium]|nr:SAM-dependent methyltransferase [Roseiflexaceae bacterium]
MTIPEWAADVPLDRPSPARMYDYYLGGHHNFAIDRAAAEQFLAVMPNTRVLARVNRAFLGRAVTFLAEQGIDQFLDLGSGIPTVGNVHEIVQAVRPNARVVYVDHDPVAVAHTEALLAGNPSTAALQLDVRHADELLRHPTVRRMLDLRRPVGLLMVALLHFVPASEELHCALAGLRDGLPAGSYLALSHACSDGSDDAVTEAGTGVYARTRSGLHPRSAAAIGAFFNGWELVAPGLVHLPLWHPSGPDDLLLQTPEQSFLLGGVARKQA